MLVLRMRVRRPRKALPLGDNVFRRGEKDGEGKRDEKAITPLGFCSPLAVLLRHDADSHFLPLFFYLVFLVQENGQGLVKYNLIVVLVALIFWVAILNTNIGTAV